MAGDGLAEVLNFEGALEARGEEAAEGAMREAKVAKTRMWNCIGAMWMVGGRGGEGEGVGSGLEDGVGDAGEAGEDVGAEVLGWGKKKGERLVGCEKVLCGGGGRMERWKGEDNMGWRGRTLTGQMKYL